MINPKSKIQNPKSGFTLAELLVAMTLLSVVFVGVYTAFSSSIRLWRIGEANLKTYQDARTALSIVTRELESIPPTSAYLMQGESRQVEFYTVVEPMHPKDGEAPRPMWVQYRLESSVGDKGSRLFREERVVKGALPVKPTPPNEIDSSVIKRGPQRRFELAAGVLDFEMSYYFAPERERPDADAGPPKPVELVVKRDLPKGWGMPEGIRVVLKLVDANADSGFTTFTSLIAFRGPTTKLKADGTPVEEAGAVGRIGRIGRIGDGGHA